METTANAVTEQNKQAANTPDIGSFGNGRYSMLMSEVFADSQPLFGIDEQQADKLARAVGRDFGAAMAYAKVDAKVSRSINKDGKVTLSEAAKVKGITTSNALEALRVLQFMNEAGKFHIVSRKTGWVIAGTFKEYIESL